MKAMGVFKLDVTRWDRQAPLETVWLVHTNLWQQHRWNGRLKTARCLPHRGFIFIPLPWPYQSRLTRSLGNRQSPWRSFLCSTLSYLASSICWAANLASCTLSSCKLPIMTGLIEYLGSPKPLLSDTQCFRSGQVCKIHCVVFIVCLETEYALGFLFAHTLSSYLDGGKSQPGTVTQARNRA